jgi:ADP-heptose:LPS heptosyltransferase
VIATAKRLVIGLLRALCQEAEETESFLIPAYTGLGNFIMTTPMILALRRLYPRARIYIVAGNPFGTDQVFRRGDGIVDDVLWLDQRLPSWKKALFFLGLRSRRIATVFLPFDAAPSFVRWGALLAGIPHHIGHLQGIEGERALWTCQVLTRHIVWRRDTHEIDIQFDLLDLLDLLHPGTARSYETHVGSDGDEVLERFGLRRRKYAVVTLSAANAAATAKCWFSERYAALIALLNRDGFTAVLPGDRNEVALIGEFAKRHGLDVVNLAGKTSITEVSTIIKHAALMVAHDTGLMQIGNAHHVPMVVLFGPSDIFLAAPKSPESHVIYKALSCSPCMKNFQKSDSEALRDCPINVQCMRDISVDEVYLACQEVLRKSRDSKL